METLQKETSRKQVTILHTDISGFEKISELLPSEEVTQYLNNCFQLMESIISLYGGSIEKISGDEMMAVFGMVDFTDKTPINALNAAIELQSKIQELYSEEDLPIAINLKIGIHTGSILLGKFGSGKNQMKTILGETVTLASRICDMAENGQVLTGEKTFKIVNEKFECQDLEPVPIKGRKKPLPVFEIKGRKRVPISTGLKQSRVINSKMIGRDHELNQLEKHVMQLINGRGGVANIIGKAGIGKSRLMAEIKLSDILEKVAVFEGRALSNGKNLSFHPIIQIIKSWAGITEDDSTGEAKRKLEANIQRIYSEAFEEVFTFIATMMGYRLEGKAKERIKDIEGEALENLILKNMRELLSKASLIRPIIIVIEDAHWCDNSSIIFMESLFKLVQKQRILFINVFKPGHKETGERIQKFLTENLKDHHQEIIIESLTKEESDELIDNLINKVELPDDINSLIIDRASGNPFFIEEVIRSFIDEGLIQIKENQFLLTDNIKYANIPETIDNVLLSRIERLDDKTKNLLRTASVIGRNFYYKVLEEAAQTIEEVDNKLEYLKDVQLINERKQKDEVEFLFKHALAQQATYDSIMEKTRKNLHLKIAGSIEKVFAGRIHEFYGTLAHHYSKAEHETKKEEYLIKAGIESIKIGASSEAVYYIKQALRLIDRNASKQNQQTVIDLEEKMAFALAVTGQWVESIEYCERLIAYYYKPLPKSNFRRFVDLFVNIFLLYRIMYSKRSNTETKNDEVNQKLIKILILESHSTAYVDPKKLFFDTPYAARFFNRKHFGKDEAMTIMSASGAFLHTGIFFNLGKRVVEWGKNFIDEEFPIGWIIGKFCVAMLDYDLGEKVDISNEKKVTKYAIQVGEFFYSTNYYFFSCLNIIESGDEILSQHFMNRILQISEAFDSNASLAHYHRINITYNLKFRKLDELIKITDEVVDFLRKKNLIYVLIALYSYRSMAFILRSNLSEARKNLEEAEKIVKSLKIITLINIFNIAKCNLEIAEFRQETAKVKDADYVLKSTKKLIKLARNVKKNLTEAFRLRALTYCLMQKPTKALHHFEKSINAGLKYDCNLELSRTYIEAGKFLHDLNNKKERINGMNGAECLMKAKSMFEEMNLQWDLNEYEKYMKRI